MTKLDDIAKAVEQFTLEELAEFCEWFEALQARRWDEPIERDITAGKLDWLSDKAEAEHRAGLTRKLE